MLFTEHASVKKSLRMEMLPVRVELVTIDLKFVFSIRAKTTTYRNSSITLLTSFSRPLKTKPVEPIVRKAYSILVPVCVLKVLVLVVLPQSGKTDTISSYNSFYYLHFTVNDLY